MGRRLRCELTWPNERSRSTRSTLPAPRSAARRARLVAMVVVPTPPLGLNTAITRLPDGSPMPRGPTEPRHGLLGSDGHRLNAGQELRRLEWPADDFVRARLQQPDPVLQAVGVGDAKHRHRRRCRGCLEAGDRVSGRRASTRSVDDDEAVAGSGCDELIGLRHDGHAVAGRGEHLLKGLGACPIGGEDQDRELHGSPRDQLQRGCTHGDGGRIHGPRSVAAGPQAASREGPPGRSCYPPVVLSAPSRRAVSGADPIGRSRAGCAPL